MCTYHFFKKKKWNGIVAMALPKQKGKQILQLVCDNAIAEIGGKKTKEKIGNCGNPIAENGKEKNVTFTIFLQHFHNKLQVIRYYQFKFEFNIEITFLIQQ